MSKEQITMYGADWCGDCRRSKRLLAELGVEYTHIDVEEDLSAADKVREINGGAQSIPVIVFSDVGVSKTRSWPNFSTKPLVVPKILFGSFMPNPKATRVLSCSIAK